MIDQKAVAYVRKRFETEGISALHELATDPKYKIACVRIFLPNWQEWLREIELWAKQILDNCDLLLPGSACNSWAPEQYQEIEYFVKEYSSEISNEIDKHPEGFSAPTISTVSIEKAIEEYDADLKNKKALDVVDFSELGIAEERLLELLKDAFKRNNIKISSFSDCDLKRIARRTLAKNPQLYDYINNNIKLFRF